ncbi:MAG: phage tail tube protein [Clostridiales bacterium]|nr:phage tail tube protein [Clostridiales bacterium]
MTYTQTLKTWDAINGAMGCVYAKVDGSVEEMFYVKDIEAVITKKKSEIKVLGYVGTKTKATGWSGSGTMNMYYCTSYFRKMMLEYANSGVDTYFDLYIENEDPSSEIGTQRIWLKRVNINTVNIGKLNTDSTELSETIDFTFDGVEILESFDEVEGE